MSFRATKDIDMIILLEDRYQEFAKAFWEYIKEGGYNSQKPLVLAAYLRGNQ